jgi:hypothetical protein
LRKLKGVEPALRHKVLPADGWIVTKVKVTPYGAVQATVDASLKKQEQGGTQ